MNTISRALRGASAIALLGFAATATATSPANPLDYLATAQQLPHTENVTVTASGRIFAAAELASGGWGIVELTGGQLREVVHGRFPAYGGLGSADCNFTGLTSRGDTLYAACQAGNAWAMPYRDGWRSYASLLVRIETSGATPVVKTAGLLGSTSLPNGMAVASNGDIYVTDSQAPYYRLYGSAAIHRLRVTDAINFKVSRSKWYPADQADWFPNGLDFQGDDLLYVTGPQIKRIRINADGSAGATSVVYQVAPGWMIDDIEAVPTSRVPGGAVLTAEITDPRDPANPTQPRSVEELKGQLALISTHPDSEGALLGVHGFGGDRTPSSVALYGADAYPYDSVIFTDYFQGGVHFVPAGYLGFANY